jgi:hypothetical protein
MNLNQCEMKQKKRVVFVKIRNKHKEPTILLSTSQTFRKPFFNYIKKFIEDRTTHQYNNFYNP